MNFFEGVALEVMPAQKQPEIAMRRIRPEAGPQNVMRAVRIIACDATIFAVGRLMVVDGALTYVEAFISIYAGRHCP